MGFTPLLTLSDVERASRATLDNAVWAMDVVCEPESSCLRAVTYT